MLVDQLISEFMNTSDKKFQFNLHHFTSVQGWELLDVATISSTHISYSSLSVPLFLSFTSSGATFYAVKSEGDRKFQYRIVAGQASLENERFLRVLTCVGASSDLTAATGVTNNNYVFRILKS